MKVEFDDASLEELERNLNSTAGYGESVDLGFRTAMIAIRCAVDERDIDVLIGLQKLKGNLYSTKIDGQWKLIVEVQIGNELSVIRVISIEN